MNKEIAIIATTFVAAALLVGGLIIQAKFFPDSIHDSLWQEERIETMKSFAGCNYRSDYITADDEFFANEWNTLSKKYEFSKEEVDNLIPECLDQWRNETLPAIEERASHPKRSLTEGEIEKEVNQALVAMRVHDDKSLEGRMQSEDEKIESEKNLRQAIQNDCWDLKDQVKLMAHMCSDDVEKVKRQISEIEIYQKKFLGQEFSTLKQ